MAKSVSRMNKEELLDELAQLVEEGVEFDEEYSEDTKNDDLCRLVQEGRDALEEDGDEEGDEDESDEEDEEDEEDESDEEDDDEGDEGSDEEDEDESDDDVDLDEGAPKGAGVHVYDRNGKYVRTYTKETVKGSPFKTPEKAAESICSKNEGWEYRKGK